MRRTFYNGSTKSIANLVVQTLVWTATEVPSERVVAYHFTLQGAAGANGLDDISRIRISANGSNIVNITPTMLRAYWQSYTGGRVKVPAAATSFTVPFCLLDAPIPDAQDVSQFPARSQVQIELVTAATIVTGAAFVGWTETTISPEWFPRILGSTLNIPASTSLQRYSFQENGIVRGIQLPHTGIDRARFVLGNQDFTFLPSLVFQGFTTGDIGDMLFEAESLYGDGPGSAGTPLTTAPFSRITANIPAPVDGSYIELQTGVGFAASNEACIYAIAPNGIARPAAA